MMSPLLLHQVVDDMHNERIRVPRQGRSVVARVVSKLHQVAWRAASLSGDVPRRDVPMWLELLPDCVDEPALVLVGRRTEPARDEPVCEECGKA
jgi:hypothetical protein